MSRPFPAPMSVAVILVLALSLIGPAVGAQDLPDVPELPGTGAEGGGTGGGGAAAPDGTVIFPTDTLTVADPAQASGRRMNLPRPDDCVTQASRCADVDLINTLDGFDLLPRVTVQLDTAPAGDLAETFTSEVLGVRTADGGDPIGLARFVYDPDAQILYGEPAEQLVESTAYEVVYQGQATAFTTMTATAGLAQMRRQLDSGDAYQASGIADGDREISFDQGDLRTVFDAAEVATITRYDEVVPGGDLVDSVVLDTAVVGVGTVAFGSFLAPSWLSASRVIAPSETGGDGPTAVGSERIGVTLLLPAGSPPEGGWPLAIFGPGITRSKYDVFLAADLNAAQGLATMSFDPVGHAFGPGSEIEVQTSTSPDAVRFAGFGRGIDLNDDGVITNQEGVQAPSAPHPDSSVGLRDGLRQTATDLMSLVRAVQQGADVDGDGTDDLSTDDISVFAQSLGGIYSTLFMGVDPEVEVAALNVPGGAILDIARVSPGFRPVVADILRDRVPGMLNGGINTFDEDLGLFGVDPATDAPVDGAPAIQQVLYDANWIARSGSPEAFAPRIQADPLSDSVAKSVLYQFALGDQTVPNPASFRLARAFGDNSHVALYRNDLTASAMLNPHGFLLDPTIQGRNQAQQQVVTFLTSDGQTIIDPDGPLPTWETPIADVDILLERNFGDDLYEAATPRPERQTSRIAAEGDIATAIAVSEAVFDEAATVVLARVDEYADGLAGGPLAGVNDAPLLLSEKDTLPADVGAEIKRLGADTAILLGGVDALSQDVADALEAQGVTVDRIGGANRFGTAAMVADRIGYSSEVLLVEGENADAARGFPDALSAAGIGAGLGLPILLTNATRLPEETANALSDTQDVTIVGGTVAVRPDIEDQVAELVDQVDRIEGPTRFHTAGAAADEAILRGLEPTTVWLATGTSFADGLVAGAAAGTTGGTVILVDPDDLDRSSEVARWLSQHGASVNRAFVVGSTDKISAPVETQIRERVAP